MSAFLIAFFIGSCFIQVHKVIDAYIEEKEEPELALAKIGEMRVAVSMREKRDVRELGSSPFTLGDNPSNKESASGESPTNMIKKINTNPRSRHSLTPEEFAAQEEHGLPNGHEPDSSIIALAAAIGVPSIMASVDSDKVELCTKIKRVLSPSREQDYLNNETNVQIVMNSDGSLVNVEDPPLEFVEGGQMSSSRIELIMVNSSGQISKN